MNIHLYAACWNERDALEAFFAHYDPWIERYVIYDDGSDDGSIERLRAHPRVTLRRLQHTHPDSLVLSLRDLYDHAWKQSRGEADWVVVVNIDEHLHHPRRDDYLSACRDNGITAIPALGYQVLQAPHASAPLPCRATPFVMMNKLALFDPSAIDEIGYAVGRHTARPRGRVRYPERDELLNLHYKCADPIRLRARHAQQAPRLGPQDRRLGFGNRYHYDDAQLQAWLDELQAASVWLDGEAHVPARDHGTSRWWRDAVAP